MTIQELFAVMGTVQDEFGFVNLHLGPRGMFYVEVRLGVEDVAVPISPEMLDDVDAETVLAVLREQFLSVSGSPAGSPDVA